MFLRKTKHKVGALIAGQQVRFNRAQVNLEKVFLDIQRNGKTTAGHCRDAMREYLRINIHHADFYFIVFGMGLMVFATRSFTEPGTDYGPWRPVVIGFAAILAGFIPICVEVALYPLHLMKGVNIWVITAINVFVSANIFAFVEPVIPHFFYDSGVLHYHDLIFGIVVFYLIALLYLQLRLHKIVSLDYYRDRQKIHNVDSILPANTRGDVLALSAQDHYVKIITNNGHHLHRMTMTEAVAMQPDDAGLQVHRSHWVAYDAMLGLTKIFEKPHLELRNGAKIPVSRHKIADVKKHLHLE